MSLLMIFRVALRAIWRNKVRSLLTALGIIVGIAVVIAVIAIGTGAGEQMKSSINSMGNNLVMIFPNFMRSSGVSLGAGAANTLTAADGEQIEKDFPNLVAGQTPMVKGQRPGNLRGEQLGDQHFRVGTGFPVVRGWNVGEGTFFSEDDVSAGRRPSSWGRRWSTTSSPMATPRRQEHPRDEHVLQGHRRHGEEGLQFDGAGPRMTQFSCPTTVKRAISGTFNNVSKS